MKKHDKLVVLIGVAILVIASIGIYSYVDLEVKAKPVNYKDFFDICGEFSSENLDGITVSDSNPFYPLIATPLAVNYDKENEQTVKPLYIKNLTEPSEAIEKAEDQIGIRSNEIIESGTPKNVSLDLAEKYWKKSKAALLIKSNQDGYNLGIVATPLASYLSIPVIVTNETDNDVIRLLDKLGVTRTMVCGELEPYKDYIKFEDAEEIIDMSIDLVSYKFADVDYITLTNPIDAFPPEVLDINETFFPETVIKSASMNGNMVSFLVNFMGGRTSWEFTIPDDYKYALVEITGCNHNIDGVSKFGDTVDFDINPVDETAPGLGHVSTASGIPDTNDLSDILEDKVYTERLLYDCGGKEYTISAGGSWAVEQEGTVSAAVTIKKLDNPRYEMMKGLSTIAPYLTAYHKGIVFAKPEFAFVADDDVLDKDLQTCPGFYLPGRNARLVPMSNKHVYDNIHEPLNRLLAKIENITYEKESDLENLYDHYLDETKNIAILGGATAIPRYFYDNEVEPIDDPGYYYYGGGGTQSDNIYGNIDPKEDWSNMADDQFTEYPSNENNVGRIIGWDAQDADALILRTIFYDEIIENYYTPNWKDTFGVITGGGTDFSKPFWLWLISKIPGTGLITDLTGGMLDLRGPWKYETGYTEIMRRAIIDEIGNKYFGEENVLSAYSAEGMLYGYTDEALEDIKTMGLWNRLTFSIRQVKDLAGVGNVKGKELCEDSNFLFINAHGAQHNFGIPGPELVAAGFDGVILNAPNLWQKIIEKLLPGFVVGFWGPGGDLEKIGSYTPRTISTVDFGPSVLFLDSCFCGKINGIYPKASLPGAFIHSGVNAFIASTTGSNIAGGYIEPKNHMFDTKLSVWRAKRAAEKNADQGEYQDFHFALNIYDYMLNELKTNDCTVGEAFRLAKNQYIPSDADWQLWWAPPLTTDNPLSLEALISMSSGGETGYGYHMYAKYTTYHEFVLYGDPAFNPYMS